jgi:hypothetical protein
MRILFLICTTWSSITILTTGIRAQSTDREVLMAIAADIATKPGTLLGVGPLADSARKRLPHRITVDHNVMCSKGPDRCSALGPNEAISLFASVAERMGARLESQAGVVTTSNQSTYRFSEVTIRADTAEVRVFMVWNDWVYPKGAHVVTALYILTRSGDNASWGVAWKGRPHERE